MESFHCGHERLLPEKFEPKIAKSFKKSEICAIISIQHTKVLDQFMVIGT